MSPYVLEAARCGPRVRYRSSHQGAFPGQVRVEDITELLALAPLARVRGSSGAVFPRRRASLRSHSSSVQTPPAADRSRRRGGGAVPRGPGRGRALGGVRTEFPGIGGPPPCRSASSSRQRASRYTIVLGTSLSGLKPPTESP